MLNKMLKWRKKNSKGFSLVELIIVIAIMAILVGILAPTFIQYVEKSRVSADKSSVQEIVTAIQTYYADADHPATAKATDTVTLLHSPTSAVSVTAETNKLIEPALKAAGLSDTLPSLKSASWTKGIKIDVKVSDDGIVSVVTDPTL